MGKHTKTTSIWKGGRKFLSQHGNSSIEVDSGGFGFKALLLAGLAGCSGTDVVLILEKMKVPFADLQIDVETEQTEEDPKVFKDILITYKLKTSEENRAKVKRAIELSQDKYCGVSAMLRKHSKIDYKLIIEPESQDS